jgi:hypothetical protein
LGAFNAESVKTVVIYSNTPWVSLLARPKPQGLTNPGMTNKYHDRAGRARCSGGPALKGSQCPAVLNSNAA